MSLNYMLRMMTFGCVFVMCTLCSTINVATQIVSVHCLIIHKIELHKVELTPSAIQGNTTLVSIPVHIDYFSTLATFFIWPAVSRRNCAG